MSYTTSAGTPNLEVPNTVPYAMRQAHVAFYRFLDDLWQPVISTVMPSIAAPVKGMADQFMWPKFVDAMGMARFYAFDEPVDYIGTGADAETFMTRLAKIGYKQRTDEFKQNFVDGLIDQKYRILAEYCMKYLARLKEYTTTQYIYGNTTVISSFSNQSPTGRQLKLDATSASDATNYNIKGTGWEQTTSAKPYQDMLAIRKNYADMKGGNITRGFLGQAAVFFAELNDDLTDRTKYTRDVTGGVLGLQVGGIDIAKIASQKYKSDANESVMIGYPGRGSLAEDTWASRNKFEMMRTADGTREWALFTGDRVGFVFHSRVNTEDSDPLRPFVYVWKIDEPIEYRTRFEEKFCPAVEDWANFIILDKVCTI